jgi:hypothetical protein
MVSVPISEALAFFWLWMFSYLIGGSFSICLWGRYSPEQGGWTELQGLEVCLDGFAFVGSFISGAIFLCLPYLAVMQPWWLGITMVQTASPLWQAYCEGPKVGHQMSLSSKPSIDLGSRLASSRPSYWETCLSGCTDLGRRKQKHL